MHYGAAIADLFVRDTSSSEQGSVGHVPRRSPGPSAIRPPRRERSSSRAATRCSPSAWAVGLPASPVDPTEPVDPRRNRPTPQTVGRASGIASGGGVVYLLTTGAGGVAVPEGDADPVWLDQLGGDQFQERGSNAYGSALDALRRNSLLGMKTWVVEVAAMVAYLEDALSVARRVCPGAALTLVPTGVLLSLLPVRAAALGPGQPNLRSGASPSSPATVTSQGVGTSTLTGCSPSSIPPCRRHSGNAPE